MNILKNLLLGAFTVILPLLSKAQFVESGNYNLQVSAPNAGKSKFYLLYQMEGKRIVDSAELAEGKYIFKGSVDRPRQATLATDSGTTSFQDLLAKKPSQVQVLRIWLHAGSLKIIANGKLNDAQISTSALNKEFLTYEEKISGLQNEIREVGQLLEEAKEDSQKNKWKKSSDSLRQKRRELLREYIANHPKSYTSLFALQDYAGNSPNPSEVAPLFQSLSAEIQNTAFAKDIKQYWVAKDLLIPGAVAPDFAQNDTSGRPIRLSSFKGNYLLIDFWASWCGPCREQNREIVKIYSEFKDKNFAILGVSLDGESQKDNWFKAIKVDSLSWTQVSDLKHWENEAAKLYGIRSIPQAFLISPEGKIIAKGLEPTQIREILLKELK